MDRTPVSNALHPAEHWLQGDDALAMLLTSVGAYTADDRGNEQTRAHNAAKVYLAFCLGLQKAGVLSIQHAPHLWIDIGETSFKICLQHDSIITSATVSEASSSLSSEYVFVDARSGGDRVDGCGSDLAVAVKSPDGQMLSFLETVEGQLSESAVLALPDEPIDQTSQEALPDGSAVGNVARGLLRLDQVDMQSGKIGMRYNYAYYGLGQAYGIAIGVSAQQDCRVRALADLGYYNTAYKAQDNGPQGWKVARQSLTVMMQELAAYQGLAYLNNPNGRLAWSKRLQRAHKFCLLVDIFGLTILDVYPAVSVSRLDKVSLTSLEQVKRGHIGKGLTAAIKLQLSLSHS